MKRLLTINIKLCSAALVLLLSMKAFADVSVENAWLRMLPPMSKMTAGYMTLTSVQDDRLLSITSPMADNVEIHQSKEANGVMSMQHVNSLFLPENTKVTLKPQSYHLMVMGLKVPLKEGEKHTFTLTFEHAEPLTVDIPVLKK